jgi:hypothetical protein
MRRFWPTRSGPTGAASAASPRSIRCWSSCANGRAWRRNCGPSATGWATASANSSGATIQLLDLADDVAAGWVLDLWALLPTPEKARRVREETVARLLKRHRIRRFSAGDVLEGLRRPAILVAPGTTEAAVAHVQALAKRLDLVNRQIAEAETRLDRLTERMAQV